MTWGVHSPTLIFGKRKRFCIFAEIKTMRMGFFFKVPQGKVLIQQPISINIDADENEY